LLGGIAACLVIVANWEIALLAGAGPVAWRGRKNDQSVPDEARMWLTRLRYLQAFTTGYSGTLRLPAGAQLEATTIFSIPHCLYLVSVSDDALAAFEQRAFVARTAFDNAFDEVVQAGYLDFEAASSLLRSRVAGLPRSLIALCHALSGGLPRDLIRATRSLIDLCAEGHCYIAGQCEAMVATETDTLEHACLTTLAARPDQLESTGLLPRLLDRSWPGRSGEDLLRALDQACARQEFTQREPGYRVALVTRFRAARGLLLPDRPWRPGVAP